MYSPFVLVFCAGFLCFCSHKLLKILHLNLCARHSSRLNKLDRDVLLPILRFAIFFMHRHIASDTRCSCIYNVFLLAVQVFFLKILHTFHFNLGDVTNKECSLGAGQNISGINRTLVFRRFAIFSPSAILPLFLGVFAFTIFLCLLCRCSYMFWVGI